jgi:hypothetical protein
VDGKAMVICDPAAEEKLTFAMRCVGPEDPSVAALCASPLTVDESDPRSVAMGALYASICSAAITQGQAAAQGQAQAAKQGQAVAQAQAAKQQGQGEAVVEEEEEAPVKAQAQAPVKAQAQAPAPAQAQAQAQAQAKQVAALGDVPISMAIFASIPLDAAMAHGSLVPTPSLFERYHGVPPM